MRLVHPPVQERAAQIQQRLDEMPDQRLAAVKCGTPERCQQMVWDMAFMGAPGGVVIGKGAQAGASVLVRLFNRIFGRTAATALPQIAKASNGQMLGQAIGHVKGLAGTAAQKADLFQQLGAQVTKLSGGSWTAARGVGTEGSHVFLGGAGEALVINPAGQLFRGSLQTGGVSIAGPGKYALDFAKLTGL